MISRVSHFSSSTSGMGSGLVIEDHVRRGKAGSQGSGIVVEGARLSHLLVVSGSKLCGATSWQNCI